MPIKFPKRGSKKDDLTLPKPKSWWRYGRVAVSWLVALTIALALQRFAFQSYQVFGQSMEPTLREGDYLIISKLGYTWADIKNSEHLPERGDILVIISPIDGERLIKRVVGLPDEKVTVQNGAVRVYNAQSPHGFDPYENLGLPNEFVSGQISTIVPQDHIFVVGDNRISGGSLDSRNELGTVPVDNIIGKLVIRLWPFSGIQTF